jgi:hypothetical protein
MATESKLGGERQNTIGKGTKEGSTRAKERENTRPSESTRERKREKQREREQPSERASEREKEKPAAGAAGARVPVPAHRRRKRTGDPPRGTNEKRSEQKKKDET